MNFIIEPIAALPGLLAARKAALALVQKLADSLAGQTAQPGGQPLPRLMQQIELEHAGYRYTPGKPVLQDLSATLKAGKAYAVVGASGGGKSTLLRLLHIPDDNTSGQVLFDGIDIRRLTPESLNGLVSVVQQNVFVFNASIRDNITMFRAFPQETLDEVIRRAHLEELVARRGLDALCRRRRVRAFWRRKAAHCHCSCTAQTIVHSAGGRSHRRAGTPRPPTRSRRTSCPSPASPAWW